MLLCPPYPHGQRSCKTKDNIQKPKYIILAYLSFKRWTDSKAIAKIEASPTELPTSWSMDMLEGRVAAREKMGRLEEALSDADRMLKVELANPRVHLPGFATE